MDVRKSHFCKFYLPAIVFGALILVASSIPIKPPEIERDFQIDKVFHLIEYCLFAVLVIRAFTHSNLNFLKNNELIATFIFVGLFALVDEAYQSLIPYRDSSIFDAMFDTAGGVIGSLLYKFKIKKAQ